MREILVFINDWLVINLCLFRPPNGKMNFGKSNVLVYPISLELIKVPLLFLCDVLNSTPTFTAFVIRIADLATFLFVTDKFADNPKRFPQAAEVRLLVALFAEKLISIFPSKAYFLRGT